MEKSIYANNDEWRNHPGLAGKDLLYTKEPFGKISVREFGDQIMAKKIAHEKGGEHTRHASGLFHIIRDTPKEPTKSAKNTIKRVLKSKTK